MIRLVELGTIGGVIAAAWILAAWAAGAGAGLSWWAWGLIAAALVVTYGGAVELCVRAWAREQDGRREDQ